MARSLSAYQGSDPYIFVSYAHADEHLVLAELGWLMDHEFNIWFDEGIHPGSRWTEDIAQSLREASLVLYYVTPNSAASENCANEIDYALDNKRQVLPVHLKRTELSEGQKLALGGRQMILRHQLSREAYEDKLLAAIATQMGREVPVTSPRRGAWLRLPAKLALTSLVALLAAGLWYWQVGSGLEPTAARALDEPLPLLIADFDNRTGVTLFEGTLEQAITIGLEAAPFISAYPRTDARKTLGALGGNAGLDEDGARLIALRESLKLVLVGVIEKDGERIELSLNAIEPVSGEIRVEASVTADSQLEVLEAIATLTNEIRRQLGDVSVEQSALDETLSARSLEAAAHYTRAQTLAADWKHGEAVLEYEQAVAIDDQLGRAYGGWAYSALQLGQTQRALELWEHMMTLTHTMTEREQLSALGMYWANAVNNQDKAIETFTELVNAYPGDARGANNLAMVYFLDREFDNAIAVQEKLLAIYPNRALYRSNYALYYMYAGDFDAASREAETVITEHPDYLPAYLPRAVAALAAQNYRDAKFAYSRIAELGSAGQYLAEMGRADLSIARGDYQSAIRTLQDVIASDASRSMVRERILLGSAQLRSDDRPAAMQTIEAIDRSALTNNQLLQLGEVLIALELLEDATALATRLRSNLRDVPRAYGYLLSAQIALHTADYPAAIDSLNSALEISDMWLAHFVRGRVYLEAGLYPEAMEEFRLCLQRNGEGIAVFMDDIPTYHRVVETRYWYARAQQAVGQAGPALRAFQDYIDVRDLAAADATIVDARERLRDLQEQQSSY